MKTQHAIPEDPPGFTITYTDDGQRFVATRADGEQIGVFDTRQEAIDACTSS